MKPSPNRLRIDAEVAALKALLPQVPVHSAFGDNHHQAIKAQIDVLKHNLTYEQMQNRADAALVKLTFRGDVWSDYVFTMALFAFRWRQGTEPEPPSLDWQKLVQTLSQPAEPALT